MELTTDLIDTIHEKVTEGNFPTVAAVSSGVPALVFEGWMRRGNTEISRLADGGKVDKQAAIYVHLVTSVESAQAIAESRAVSFWQNHVSGNWQAAKEFLSRRFPERWSNNPPPSNPS